MNGSTIRKHQVASRNTRPMRIAASTARFAGLLPSDWAYSCNAVSGYSGGGKALIARFEDDAGIAFRDYGLALGHKHVPEMQRHARLEHAMQ